MSKFASSFIIGLLALGLGCTQERVHDGHDHEDHDHDQVGSEVEDATGLGPLPTLSGDRAQDRAQLVAALDSLKTAWSANQAKFQELATAAASGGSSGSSTALEEAKALNEAFADRADQIQLMLDKLRE